MKLAFLDTKAIGEDLDLSAFHSLGEVVTYPFTSVSQASEHIQDADVIILNKLPINADTIGSASNLKLVCVTGTGTNHLDKEYLEQRKIAWRNVADYSTESVSQHTFAMLFYLLENLRYYDDYVKSGHYVNDTSFTHYEKTFCEIKGKTWGIIGLGNIGRRVASIAEAFGANVIYSSPSGNPPQDGYQQVPLDTLLQNSDIISIHAPLNAYTENLIDGDAFAKMKPSCIFLNLGRGAIVVEEALVSALNQNQIRAAGLDVICTEPMAPDSPLHHVIDQQKLLITPHVAWASVESRTRLMNTIYQQIQEFFA